MQRPRGRADDSAWQRIVKGRPWRAGKRTGAAVHGAGAVRGARAVAQARALDAGALPAPRRAGVAQGRSFRVAPMGGIFPRFAPLVDPAAPRVKSPPVTMVTG